jgi:hypothetical protein
MAINQWKPTHTKAFGAARFLCVAAARLPSF